MTKKYRCYECLSEFPANKLRGFNGFYICQDCWNISAYSYWDLFGDPVEASDINTLKYEVDALQDMLDKTPERYCIDRMSLEARLEKVKKELDEKQGENKT